MNDNALKNLKKLLESDHATLSSYNDTMVGDYFMTIATGLSKPGFIMLLTHLDGTIICAATTDPSESTRELVNKRMALNLSAIDQVDSKTDILTQGSDSLYVIKTGLLLDKHYLLMQFNSESSEYDQANTLDRAQSMLSSQIRVFEKYDTVNHTIIHALDSIEDAITFCDKDGYLIFANNKCCEILDVPKQVLLGRRVDYLTDIKPILMQVLESKKKLVDVEYFMRYEENTFHLTTSAYPVYGDSDEIIGAIDIFQTIERTRKLASSIAGYRAYFTFEHIIGQSEAIQKTKNMAKIFAKYDESVLITGESGTGKELFAQSIHTHSHRSDRPFIAINCANFPNDLIDSELFGYEEGAFTGAAKGGKPGKFEVADGGTLFLDEIGEMQFHLQAKLLRVLETMTINRIGSNKPIQVDVRIIAATNQNLDALVREGKFRKDLYYRLKVLYLETPSLKERREDIPLLANHFIKSTVQRSDKEVLGLTDGAKGMLMAHDWAGNVRELENTISRSVYICEGLWITDDTLASAGMSAQDNEPVYVRKNIVLSKELITETYNATGSNKKRTAEILSVSRPTLYKLLKKYNIEN